MLTILELLKSVLKLVTNGSSKDAPAASTPDGKEIPSLTQTILKIERKNITTDGVFGVLTVNGTQVCETVENLGEEIPEGLYDAKLDKSPRLGYVCPHIVVPMRDVAAGGDAGIRIHVANEPAQLKGCIAVGTRKDGDAEDESKKAFDKLMALLPPSFKVLIYTLH